MAARVEPCRGAQASGVHTRSLGSEASGVGADTRGASAASADEETAQRRAAASRMAFTPGRISLEAGSARAGRDRVDHAPLVMNGK